MVHDHGVTGQGKPSLPYHATVSQGSMFTRSGLLEDKRTSATLRQLTATMKCVNKTKIKTNLSLTAIVNTKEELENVSVLTNIIPGLFSEGIKGGTF